MLKNQKPKMSKELDGFEIEINEFGEIVSSMPIEEVNHFLDKNLADKKLKNTPHIVALDDDDDWDEEEDNDFDEFDDDFDDDDLSEFDTGDDFDEDAGDDWDDDDF